MSAETIAELLKLLESLPADKAAQARAILAEAGFDFKPRAEPFTAGFLLVCLLAVVLGFAIALAIVAIITRKR